MLKKLMIALIAGSLVGATACKSGPETAPDKDIDEAVIAGDNADGDDDDEAVLNDESLSEEDKERIKEEAEEDEMNDPQASEKDGAEGMARIDLVTIMAAPVDFVGTEISGVAYVDEIVSDRGFYITDGDVRLFAVVREDTPRKEMIDIDKGDMISFTGLLLEQEAWDDLTGTIEEPAKKAIMARPYFVAAYHGDVTILNEENKKANSEY